MDLNAKLATANASLSLVSAACLIAGFVAIRRRRVERHRTLMLIATLASFAFMVLFVIRFARFGFREFHGPGGWRGVYQLIFFSHEPLAVINIPLALGTLVLGLRRSYATHKEIARVALPVWLYVALTGVMIYVMLYRFPGQ